MTSKKALKNGTDHEHEHNHNHGPKFKSRAQKTFDDDQSQTDGEEGSENLKTDQALKRLNTQGEEISNKPNPRFKHYKELFNNLLKSTNVPTLYPICSVIISYDSKYAITVTKKDEREYYVKMYDLETYELEFEEKIGGKQDDYIKLKEVEQNSKGNKFAIVYFNDGNFKLRTFTSKPRSEQEVAQNELDINKLVGYDNWTMAISGFPDPYITCCFVDDNRVFVNLFYNFKLEHCHFIYNIETKKVEGEI